MAITASAKKAHRRSLRRRVFNIRRKDAYKEAVKMVKKAITAGNPKEAEKLLSAAYKAIDKAAKNHVIAKNAASRTKSRLTAAIRRISK